MKIFSDKDWSYLLKYFELLRPIRKQLESDRRVSHYLERIYSYLYRNSHKNSCSLIIRKLSDLFPNVIED
jgi:hypothetical protein